MKMMVQTWNQKQLDAPRAEFQEMGNPNQPKNPMEKNVGSELLPWLWHAAAQPCWLCFPSGWVKDTLLILEMSNNSIAENGSPWLSGDHLPLEGGREPSDSQQPGLGVRSIIPGGAENLG